MPRKADYTEAKPLYDQGLSDIELGKKLGLCSATVCKWRKRNNLPPNTCKRITEEEYKKIEILYLNGLNDCQIAREIDRPYYIISQWRYRNDLPSAYKQSVATIPDEEKPWHDPESLFCDTPFLDEIMRKPVRRVKTDAIQ